MGMAGNLEAEFYVLLTHNITLTYGFQYRIS